ncbi:MAG TPA: RHS repeat-associated core domain-containing protein, partial [Clostridia bacterium]|nr:RHS repeat-associated core domain-containing protein [Clostridia bacterium]
FDGVWAYEWDAENRLKAMSMTNLINLTNNANRLRLEFAYDYLGRRVSKTVKTWNGSSAFINPVINKFVYDGWNLVAVLDAQSALRQSFLWGQDLSGTENEAGGIGGLLAILEIANNQISNCHFASYDGNGNVTALVRASDFSTTARYEYSPYGEILRLTGPLAKANSFRFSTKFTDDESGLLYYGFRYYSPTIGRWFGRDPLAEEGGLNLYEFVNNYPIGAFDVLGQNTFVEILIYVAEEYGEKGVDAAKNLPLVKRVRDVVNTLDSIQSFTSGYMRAEDMLGGSNTSMLERLAALRSEQAQGLRGGGSLSRAEKATDIHHIFPQQFREVFKRMARGDFKNFDIDAFGVAIQKQLHQKGLHGGGYNRLWEEFTKKYGNRLKNDPMFAIGFGFGLINELGFGNHSVVPW